MGLDCGSAKTVPEPGAVLLHVKCATGVPTPDELRVWVYDDGGRLWDGVRIPPDGPLAVTGAQDLGTILIQPGTIHGKLRVHVRGFVVGARVADGALKIDSPASGDRTYELLLEATAPVDSDGDDVPDSIDDCLGAANPAQGGCPAPSGSEPGPDASSVEAGVADGPGDAPAVPVEAGAPLDLGNDRGPDTTTKSDSPVDLPTIISGLDAQADAVIELPPDTASDAVADARANTVADAVVEAGPDARPDGGLDADASIKPDTGVDAAADGAADAIDSSGATCVDGGVCNLPQGALCAASTGCASGFCADGVCCTNACTGPCRSCNQPSATGICQGYPSGTDPEVECQSGTTCNGVGACGTVSPPNLANGQLCSSGARCLSGFCTDGVCCDTACNSPCQACGSGTCLTVKKTDDPPECTGTMTCNPHGTCVAR
jgi:hypothetical protein